jgi:hypothetical protein
LGKHIKTNVINSSYNTSLIIARPANNGTITAHFLFIPYFQRIRPQAGQEHSKAHQITHPYGGDKKG